MSSSIPLKIKFSPSGATLLGVPFHTLGGDRKRLIDKIYDITPEIHKALSSTSNTGKTMKNENDILLMNNIIRDQGYTGRGDRHSKRKTFFTITLPELVDDIQNKILDGITDDSDDSKGEGVKIFIPSNIVDIHTRLEILVGLSLSGHTVTLTKASNLIDELCMRGEIQNEQQQQNALDKFQT